MNKVELSEFIRNSTKIQKLNIKNKKVMGIGINDTDYKTSLVINGKRVMCPAYVAWSAMLARVYSKTIHHSLPTYTNVLLCKEWHTFSNFRGWWIDNYRENCQLDKDILSGSEKIYSHETCLYIPQWLNLFILDSGKTRGDYLIGCFIDKRSGKYKAECRNPLTKQKERLGSFNTEIEAHNAWLKRKLELTLEIKDTLDKIDYRLYDRIVGILKCLK